MSDTVDASGFIVIAPKRATWGNPDEYGLRRVMDARITRFVKKAPTFLEEGEVAVKVRFRLPIAAFDPLHPSAVIDVPIDLIQREVIVEAVEA